MSSTYEQIAEVSGAGEASAVRWLVLYYSEQSRAWFILSGPDPEIGPFADDWFRTEVEAKDFAWSEWAVPLDSWRRRSSGV